MDFFFALLGLFCSLPFLIIIACFIKISSFKGSVIYKQQRIGKNGKLFTLYKFRSMHSNSDVLLNKLLTSDSFAEQEWLTYQKLKKDPRIFFFGKIIRKTSLDEFPQFWNIVKGDLSLIGPRPYIENQRQVVEKHGVSIFSIRPGLTGLWQTEGRSTINFQQRIVLDEYYVKNVGFSLDMKIFFKTLYKIFYFSHAS